MSQFGYILIFSFLGSVGSLAGAAVILLFPKLRERYRMGLLSYAIGTLLGAVFIGLLPEAVNKSSVSIILRVTLAGFILFFILEKIVRIPHRHAQSTKEIHPAAPLILIGDALHNFVDGVLITTSFFFSVPLGILTSFAVVAHEIPQELGDFVILLESGLERSAAFWFNFLSSLSTFVGAMLSYWLKDVIEPYLSYFLAVAAASFLYIGTVDLSPMLHQHFGAKAGFKQTIGLLAGVGTIFLLDFFFN